MQDSESVAGGWLVAAGGLGVALITAIYATTNPVGGPLTPDLAIADVIALTGGAANRLRIAGSIGLVADILLIGGCLILALRTGEPVAKRLLWLWVMLSTAIFFVVDGLAAGVLGPIATTGDENAMRLARLGYDIAFALGVGTFGAGLIAGFWVTGWPAAMRILALATGLVSVATFILFLLGVVLPLVMGAMVGLAGIVAVVIGYREVRGA
jgi:hypothetical protein